MDEERIKRELLKQKIDWIKNTATASNFGGVWEDKLDLKGTSSLHLWDNIAIAWTMNHYGPFYVK